MVQPTKHNICLEFAKISYPKDASTQHLFLNSIPNHLNKYMSENIKNRIKISDDGNEKSANIQNHYWNTQSQKLCQNYNKMSRILSLSHTEKERVLRLFNSRIIQSPSLHKNTPPSVIKHSLFVNQTLPQRSENTPLKLGDQTAGRT